MKTPYKHQEKGIDYMVSRKNGGLFMRMRTGKTPTTIWGIESLGAFPCLIIAPSTVLAGWEDELLDLGVPQKDIIIIDDSHGTKYRSSELAELLTLPYIKYFLINFEKVKATNAFRIRKTVSPLLCIGDWKAIVIDESYRIANFESSLGEYVHRYPKPKDQHRFILTGSPASESPLNLPSQIVFADGEYFGCKSPEEYRTKYYEYNKFIYKWELKNESHREEIREYIERNMYCVTMEELGLGVEKLYSMARVELNQAQKDLLQWVRLAKVYRYATETPEDEAHLMLPIVRVGFENSIASGVNPLTKEMISTNKVEFVVKAMKEHPNEKYLILSSMREPLHALSRLLDRERITYGVIHGDVSRKNRHQTRKDFQSNVVQHCLGQEDTVKMGLDFSALDRIYRISITFSQDTRAQADDRGNHLTRTEPYHIIDVISRDTKDEKHVQYVRQKKINADYFIEDMNKELLIEGRQNG